MIDCLSKAPCSELSILTLKMQNDKGSERTHNSTISQTLGIRFLSVVGEYRDPRQPSLQLCAFIGPAEFQQGCGGLPSPISATTWIFPGKSLKNVSYKGSQPQVRDLRKLFLVVRCDKPADCGAESRDPCPTRFKSVENPHAEAWQDQGILRDTNPNTAIQTPTLLRYLVFRSTSEFALNNAGI